MKYTREQRLDIGRQIYNGEITKFQAAEKYNISIDSARDYMRLYRKENHLEVKYVNVNIEML
jgi:transposase